MLLHDKHIHKNKIIIKEIMYIHILNLLCNVIPLWPKRKLKSAVIFIYFLNLMFYVSAVNLCIAVLQ